MLNVVANQALNIEYGGNNRLWSDVSTQEDARVWALSAWLDNIDMNLNKAFIFGNLTRDPELRQTTSGQAVCGFGVATNRFYTDSSGQKQKQTEFHNVVAFGRNAEIVNQYLRKGSSVLVEGRIQTRNWQDQQGNKHWKTEIIAERIQLGPRASTTPAEAEKPANEQKPQDTTPVIDLEEERGEINIKDIPF